MALSLGSIGSAAGGLTGAAGGLTGGLAGAAGGAGAQTYSALKTKYNDFSFPLASIQMNNKPLAATAGDSIVVNNIHVELTSGFEASLASFRIYNAFSTSLGKFRFDDLKTQVFMGAPVSISLGYAEAMETVFVGFAAGVAFGYEPEDLPYIEVTAMDVKSIMMGGTYSYQLTAKSYGEAVSEIFRRTGYEKLKAAGGITALDIGDTPDKKGAAGGLGGLGGAAGGLAGAAGAAGGLAGAAGGLAGAAGGLAGAAGGLAGAATGGLASAAGGLANAATGGLASAAGGLANAATGGLAGAAGGLANAATGGLAGAAGGLAGAATGGLADAAGAVGGLTDAAGAVGGLAGAAGAAGGLGGAAGGMGGAEPASAETIEMVAESDYEFVVKAAKKFNFEFFVDRGTVIFRKAKSNTASLASIGISSGILGFHVEYSLTGLVGSIEARSSNPGDGKLLSATGKREGTISIAGKAGELVGSAAKVYVDPTITSQEQAQARVDSLMENMKYRLGSLEADCVGIPDLVPGRFIDVTGMGAPADNSFYLTSVIHDFTPEGGFHTKLTGCAAELKPDGLGDALGGDLGSLF